MARFRLAILGRYLPILYWLRNIFGIKRRGLTFLTLRSLSTKVLRYF